MQTAKDQQHQLQLVSSRTNGIDPKTGLLPQNFEIEAGVDVVYYLAQSPHYRQVPEYAAHLLSVNCVAAVQVASAAVRSGVKRFIYASTGNVYAPSFKPMAETDPVQRHGWYPLSKLMAEEALALFAGKMDVTVLRIFGIYGPGQTDKLIPTLIENVRQGRQIFVDGRADDSLDSGGLLFSPIYIGDAVNALLKIGASFTAPMLNLAGDRALSVAEIATTIATQLGTRAHIKSSGRNRSSDLVADIGLLKRLVGPVYTPFETGLGNALERVV